MLSKVREFLNWYTDETRPVTWAEVTFVGAVAAFALALGWVQ